MVKSVDEEIWSVKSVRLLVCCFRLLFSLNNLPLCVVHTLAWVSTAVCSRETPLRLLWPRVAHPRERRLSPRVKLYTKDSQVGSILRVLSKVRRGRREEEKKKNKDLPFGAQGCPYFQILNTSFDTLVFELIFPCFWLESDRHLITHKVILS